MQFVLLFVPNRNTLRLEVAQFLIFVQQNDPVVRDSTKRTREADDGAHTLVDV